MTGANRASGQLGCGAKPLKVPDDVLSRDAEPKKVTDVRDSACGTAAAQLPKDTRVRVVGGDTTPVVHCELYLETPEEERTSYDDMDRPVNAGLGAYFGDWSTSLVTGHDGRRDGNTVTARCEGESVNFDGWADDGTAVSDRELRELVLTFAKDQAKRRGCTGVRPMPAG